jgi:hypothetical protein
VGRAVGLGDSSLVLVLIDVFFAMPVLFNLPYL